MSTKAAEKLQAAFNRLGKWRSVLAGWQLGTRTQADPECQAVRDHREVSLLMRAELSGLSRILIEKKVVTLEELQTIFAEEAEFLSKAHEHRFPGFKATDCGMEMAPAIAADTMRGWRP